MQVANEKMLEVIKKIVLANKEAKKACNQIAAYEYEQDIKKLTDELVALYEETEQQSNSTEDTFYKLKKDTALAVKKYAEISSIEHLMIEARKIYFKSDYSPFTKSDYDIRFHNMSV